MNNAITFVTDCCSANCHSDACHSFHCHSVACHSDKHHSEDCHGRPIFHQEKVNFDHSRVPLSWYCLSVTCHFVTCHSDKRHSVDCHGTPYFTRKKSILISAEYHYLDIDILHIVIFHIVILWHGILWHVILLSIILLIVMAPHISPGKSQFLSLQSTIILILTFCTLSFVKHHCAECHLAPYFTRKKSILIAAECHYLDIDILYIVIFWHVIL